MTMASAGPIRREHTPDGEYRWLYAKPLDSAIGRVLTPYLPGGMVVAITIESATLY
jgi:hypothetical protein